MKNLHTFEEFLNESELNEASKPGWWNTNFENEVKSIAKVHDKRIGGEFERFLAGVMQAAAEVGGRIIWSKQTLELVGDIYAESNNFPKEEIQDDIKKNFNQYKQVKDFRAQELLRDFRARWGRYAK